MMSKSVCFMMKSALERKWLSHGSLARACAYIFRAKNDLVPLGRAFTLFFFWRFPSLLFPTSPIGIWRIYTMSTSQGDQAKIKWFHLLCELTGRKLSRINYRCFSFRTSLEAILLICMPGFQDVHTLDIVHILSRVILTILLNCLYFSKKYVLHTGWLK